MNKLTNNEQKFQDSVENFLMICFEKDIRPSEFQDTFVKEAKKFKIPPKRALEIANELMESRKPPASTATDTEDNRAEDLIKEIFGLFVARMCATAFLISTVSLILAVLAYKLLT